ncbi:unnamed protein product [Anisakis simplex]|uniref:Uncharacterized protein n=1 Tax=Anisakis simplex TaxID=6269 RepID=A0A0M3K4R6_ANISI|nr:unnamed protein product [Anisakis simplex]
MAAAQIAKRFSSSELLSQDSDAPNKVKHPNTSIFQAHKHLKVQHAELCNDYDQLRKAFILLEKKNDAEERHYIGEIEKLQKEKQAAIDEFQSYTEEKNEQLGAEQVRLQRELVEVNATLREIRRENERAQLEIRDAYEEQINRLTSNALAESRKLSLEFKSLIKVPFRNRDESGDNDALTLELEMLRERYRMLDEQYRRLHEDAERRQFESDTRIRNLEGSLMERSMRATRSAIKIEQLSLEVEKYRRNLEHNNGEFERLQGEVKRLQKDKLTVERESMERDQSLTDQLLTQSMLIDKKLNEVEKVSADKDSLIKELQSKLCDTQLQLKSQTDSVKDSLKGTEDLERQVATLRQELKQNESESKLTVDKLKWERDRAIQNLADLRFTNILSSFSQN